MPALDTAIKNLAQLAIKQTSLSKLPEAIEHLKIIQKGPVDQSDQQSIDSVRTELLQLLDSLAFVSVNEETEALENAINKALLALPITKQPSKLKVDNFMQYRMRLKIVAYLNLQSQAAEGVDRLSRKTLAENVANVAKAKGYCHGLTLLWLYIFSQAPQLEAERFFHYLETILSWDEQSLETADELVFEKFFNHLEWLQSSHRLLGLLKAHTHEAFEAISAKGNAPLVLDGSEDSPAQFSFVFTQDELANFLKDFIQEDRMVLLEGNEHATGIYFKDNAYYYYDSNFAEGHASTSNLELLAKQIFLSHGVPQQDSPRYLALSVDSFRKPEQIPADYGFIHQWFDKNRELIHRQAKSDHYTALFAAMKRRHVAMVTKLLEAGANPNVADKYGYTPLFRAAHFDDFDILEMLLKAKADPNVSDSMNNSALSLAAAGGHTKVVEMLLKAKADPNVSDSMNTSALSLAVYGGHTKVVEMLLNADADPDLPDPLKNTPLVLAIIKGNLDIIRILLHKDADPNIPDEYGQTPLHRAAVQGDKKIFELLLQEGAELRLRTHDGLTPIDVAIQYGHLDLVRYLYEFKNIPFDPMSVERALEMLPKYSGPNVSQAVDDFLYFYSYAIQDEQLSKELNRYVPSAKTKLGKNINPRLPKPKFFEIYQGSGTPLEKGLLLLKSYPFTSSSPTTLFVSWEWQVKQLLWNPNINSLQDLVDSLAKSPIPESHPINAITSYISLRLLPLEKQQSIQLSDQAQKQQIFIDTVMTRWNNFSSFEENSEIGDIGQKIIQEASRISESDYGNIDLQLGKQVALYQLLQQLMNAKSIKQSPKNVINGWKNSPSEANSNRTNYDYISQHRKEGSVLKVGPKPISQKFIDNLLKSLEKSRSSRLRRH